MITDDGNEDNEDEDALEEMIVTKGSNVDCLFKLECWMLKLLQMSLLLVEVKR